MIRYIVLFSTCSFIIILNLHAQNDTILPRSGKDTIPKDSIGVEFLETGDSINNSTLYSIDSVNTHGITNHIRSTSDSVIFADTTAANITDSITLNIQRDSISVDSALADLKTDTATNLPLHHESITLYYADFDSIVKMNLETHIVHIISKNDHDVTFTYPLNSVPFRMDLDLIHKIVYANKETEFIQELPKKQEVVDKIEIIDFRELKDWEKVSHTENPDDVAGMFETGELYAKYESPRIRADNDYLEKNALIILKKRAVRQKADIALISKKEVHRAYGDLPYMEIWGTGYSFNPVELENEEEIPEENLGE